jgi:hypothetical protein
MTSYLHRRELTCAFLCWSGYVVFWMVTVGSAVGMAVLWWLVGMVVFGSLWLAIQPLFQRWRDCAEAGKRRFGPPASR